MILSYLLNAWRRTRSTELWSPENKEWPLTGTRNMPNIFNTITTVLKSTMKKGPSGKKTLLWRETSKSKQECSGSMFMASMSIKSKRTISKFHRRTGRLMASWTSHWLKTGWESRKWNWMRRVNKLKLTLRTRYHLRKCEFWFTFLNSWIQ